MKNSIREKVDISIERRTELLEQLLHTVYRLSIIGQWAVSQNPFASAQTREECTALRAVRKAILARYMPAGTVGASHPEKGKYAILRPKQDQMSHSMSFWSSTILYLQLYPNDREGRATILLGTEKDGALFLNCKRGMATPYGPTIEERIGLLADIDDASISDAMWTFLWTLFAAQEPIVQSTEDPSYIVPFLDGFNRLRGDLRLLMPDGGIVLPEIPPDTVSIEDCRRTIILGDIARKWETSSDFFNSLITDQRWIEEILFRRAFLHSCGFSLNPRKNMVISGEHELSFKIPKMHRLDIGGWFTSHGGGRMYRRCMKEVSILSDVCSNYEPYLKLAVSKEELIAVICFAEQQMSPSFTSSHREFPEMCASLASGFDDSLLEIAAFGMAIRRVFLMELLLEAV